MEKRYKTLLEDWYGDSYNKVEQVIEEFIEKHSLTREEYEKWVAWTFEN